MHCVLSTANTALDDCKRSDSQCITHNTALNTSATYGSNCGSEQYSSHIPISSVDTQFDIGTTTTASTLLLQ
jgi:hypothetical protein